MIPYQPILFITLGPLRIYTWGTLFAVGFLLALWLGLRQARRAGIDSEKIFDLGFLILIFGILGGRLAYVIANWPTFKDNWVDIFKIWDGGLGFIGGFLLAAAASIIYIRKQKLSLPKIADLAAPSIVLAYLVGRIGCFLIHDHIGKETNVPWGIRYLDGTVRHETSIYTGLNALILLLILLYLRKKNLPQGGLFIIYLIYYSITRFAIEFFQVGPYFYKLTATQWVLIPVFLVGIYLWTRISPKLALSFKFPGMRK